MEIAISTKVFFQSKNAFRSIAGRLETQGKSMVRFYVEGRSTGAVCEEIEPVRATR
jgi:hypothetical protein